MRPAGFIAAVLIVAVAAPLGYLIARHYRGAPESTSFAAMRDPAARQGSQVKVQPEAVPSQVPDVKLPDLAGKMRSISEWHGRPLLINFWATWCGPCREEIPLLRKLRTEHAASGLEVIGIAIDFKDAVAQFARQEHIDYPILVAEEDVTAAQAFGVGLGLPTTLVADRNGHIVARHVGQLSAKKAEALLAGVL